MLVLARLPALLAIGHIVLTQGSPPAGAQGNQDLCGWIGVAVTPITSAFANSLGMAEPYGAIFEQPESRYERFNALEIMIFESPSIHNDGAES